MHALLPCPPCMQSARMHMHTLSLSRSLAHARTHAHAHTDMPMPPHARTHLHPPLAAPLPSPPPPPPPHTHTHIRPQISLSFDPYSFDLGGHAAKGLQLRCLRAADPVHWKQQATFGRVCASRHDYASLAPDLPQHPWDPYGTYGEEEVAAAFASEAGDAEWGGEGAAWEEVGQEGQGGGGGLDAGGGLHSEL